MKDIEQSLKHAIKASGLTHYALWKATGVQVKSLDRFMHNEQSLRLDKAALLATYLNLELKRKGE